MDLPKAGRDFTIFRCFLAIMMTLIRLHYRRVLVGTLFFGLAGFLQFNAVDDGATLAIDLLITSLFMLIIGLLGFIGVSLFPSFRVVMEIGALVFFAMAVLQRSSFSRVTDGLPDWILSCSVFFFFALLHHIIYGQWWQKSGLGFAVRLNSKFKTRQRPEEVWARLVPNPNDLGAYYTKTLRAFDPKPGEPGHFVQKIGLGGSAVLELQIEVKECSPFRRFHYDFHADTSDRNRTFNRGTCDIQLTDLGADGTLVEISEINEKLAVGEALLMWFDNLGAQVSASARAVLDGSRDWTLIGKMRRDVQALS